MKAIWKCHVAAVALLLVAGPNAVPVHAHPMPTVRPPPPPQVRPPTVTVPRINPRDAIPTVSPPTVSTRTGGATTPSTGRPANSGGSSTPASSTISYTMPNGEDLGVVNFNRPLPPSAAASKQADEMVRYNDGDPNRNYQPVTDPDNKDWNKEPWREQNCVGLVLEKKFGIPNAVVDAATFHDKVLVGMNVPVIDKADVTDGDIGIMFREGGGAGHAFYVQKVEGTGSDKKIIIQSKDQWERTRQGVLSEGDDVHKEYPRRDQVFSHRPRDASARSQEMRGRSGTMSYGSIDA